MTPTKIYCNMCGQVVTAKRKKNGVFIPRKHKGKDKKPCKGGSAE